MSIKNILAIVLATSVVACSNEDNSRPEGAVDVVAATVASDYTSGSHAGIKRESDGTFTALNNLLPTDSDITVAAHGNYFYRIERYNGENITKFSFDDPQTPVWQFSTKDSVDDAVSSNPQTIIFASETKAYILRYGKTNVWIVNPSATTEAEFKIGELDLSAYDDGDGKPEMNNGVIVDGKLFITMQRLAGYSPDNTSYVAVFDVATDTEIETGYFGDNVKGIPLSIRNPNSNVVYLPEDNSVYISAIGSYSSGTFIGGVEKINVTNYTKKLVLDDDNAGVSLYGKIAGFTIKSATQAYFIGYAGFTDNTLYQFNPSTGVASATNNTALLNGQISSITLDEDGDLWVSDSTNASLHVIDSTDGSEVAVIDTQLNPTKVVFRN